MDQDGQVQQDHERDRDQVPRHRALDACQAACSSCEYRATSTAATRNQYGEMYTGMPNGRAMTMPSLGSCRRPGAGSCAAARLLRAVLLDSSCHAPMLRGKLRSAHAQLGRARATALDRASPRCRWRSPSLRSMSDTLAESSLASQPPSRSRARRGEPAPPAGPSLSPSRAADFMTCPLLYRFRVIDRLPEPPSPAAARGTLVHAVLERLFDEPAGGRTPRRPAACWRRSGSGCWPTSPGWPTCSPTSRSATAWLDEAAADAGSLLHPGGPDPDRARPTARCRYRRCWSPA